MASSNEQTAQRRWQQRIASVRSKGISDSVWHGLYQQDMANVQQGKTPMSDADAVDAMRAAMGKSPLQDPHKGTSPLDVIGNIASDVKDIVTGFPGGIASLPGQAQDLWTYWTGSQAQQDAIAKQYGLKQGGDIQDVGDLLTSMGRLPFLGSFIPGVHTLGALTTSSGRKTLEEHPVGTLLDVLPFFSEAGKLATLGDAGTELGAEAARTGDVAAEEAAKTGTMTEKTLTAPSAREAFRQGHAVRGAIRATADAITKVPVIGKRIPTRTEYNSWLLRSGIHPNLRQLTRGEFSLGNEMVRDLTDFQKEKLYQGWAELSGPERDMMSRAMSSRGPTGAPRELLTPEEQQIFDNNPKLVALENAYHQFNEVSADEEGLPSVPVEGTTKSFRYSPDSPVPIAFNRSLHAEERIGRSEEKLQRLTDERDVRQGALAGKHGKVRRYLEPTAEFNAREAGPVLPETVRADAAKLVEMFRDQDPAQVFGAGLEAANLTASATRTILADLKVLGGDDGLFAKWDKFMADGNIREAQKTLTKINDLFTKHKSWERTPFGKAITDHIAELKKANRRMRVNARSYAAHHARLNNADDRVARQERIVARRREVAETRHQQFKQIQAGNNPQAFDPILVAHAKVAASNWAKIHYVTNEVELNTVLKKIAESDNWSQFKRALGEGHEAEAEQMMQEARNQWTELARQGVDPVYQHNVAPDRLKYITHTKVIPDRTYTPGFLKDTALNFGSSVHDPLASLVDYKRQMLEEAANKKFADDYVSKWVSDEETQRQRLEKVFEGMQHPAWGSTQMFVDDEMAREWDFVDTEHGTDWIRKYVPGSKTSKMIIPKGVGRALKQMSHNETGIPLKGVWDPVMKVWKFSVLTTPRHFSHIAGGGAVMAAGRHPFFFRHLGEAMKIVHQDKEELLNHIGTVNGVEPDPTWDIFAHRTMARVVGEAVGSPVRAFNHLEEFIARSYKVAVMLDAEGKGLSREEALIEANKTLYSMGEMLPIERTLIRQVFPFYGFTKHLLRYAFTYPSDYPWRAAILANLARMEQEDWQSGLPQTMQLLFWLGPTDPKTGKRTGVDFRSLDPFRSLYTDFSLAGVASQLNPILQFGLQEMGVNTLTGSAELYPNMHYDSSTGKMVADAPGNTLMNLFGQFIPQANTVDAMIGITDQYRHLRMTDPDGFKRMLWTQLGFPFAPQTFDIPKTIENSALARQSDARKAIGKAVETGDFGSAKRYDYVPIPSTMRRFFGGAKYATPGDIEAMWQRLQQEAAARGLGNMSPQALLPHVSTANLPK